MDIDSLVNDVSRLEEILIKHKEYFYENHHHITPDTLIELLDNIIGGDIKETVKYFEKIAEPLDKQEAFLKTRKRKLKEYQDSLPPKEEFEKLKVPKIKNFLDDKRRKYQELSSQFRYYSTDRKKQLIERVYNVK